MFAVEPTPHREKLWTSKWVADHDRGIYVQAITGIGRARGRTFILIQDDKTIPFETRWEVGLRDPADGDPYFIMRFTLFGASAHAKQFGFEEYKFPDEIQKKYWMRIAAEALLIYGYGYNGMQCKNRYTRVELEGTLLTRSDFGYSTKLPGSHPRMIQGERCS